MLDSAASLAPDDAAILVGIRSMSNLLVDYLQGQGFRVTQLHDSRSLLALMPADPPASGELAEVPQAATNGRRENTRKAFVDRLSFDFMGIGTP